MTLSKNTLTYAATALFFFLCALLQINDPDPHIWIIMYICSGVLPSLWSFYQSYQGFKSNLSPLTLISVVSLPHFLIIVNLHEAFTHLFHIWNNQNYDNFTLLNIFAAETIREISGCLLVLLSIAFNAEKQTKYNILFPITLFLSLIFWTLLLNQKSEIVTGFAQHCKGLLGFM